MHKSSEDDETLQIDDETFNVLSAARYYAQSGGAEAIDDGHLLLGALAADCDEAGTLRALLVRSGLKWEEIWLYAGAAIEGAGAPPRVRHEPASAGAGLQLSLDLTDRAVDVMNQAEVEAGEFACSSVHVFLACFSTPGDSPLTKTCAPLAIEPMQVRLHLKQLVRAQIEFDQLSHHPLRMLAPDGERAIDAAHAAMRASFCGRISTLHLLLGLLENPANEICQRLQNSDVNVEELRARARLAIASDGEIAGPEPKFTPAAKRAIERAKDALIKSEGEQIGTLELWQGLQPHRVFWLEIFHFGWNPDDPAARILAAFDEQTGRSIAQNSLHGQTQPEYSLRPFQLFLGGQIGAGLLLRALQGWGWLYMRDIAKVAVLSVAAFSLFCTFIFALVGAIFSRSESLKKSWLLGFIGAVLGAIALYLIALH